MPSAAGDRWIVAVCAAFARTPCRLAPMLLVALVASVAAGRGAEPDTLADQARQLFQARCVKCHGPIDPKGALDLSSLASLAKGAEDGPVVVKGKLEESTLWRRIDDGDMPPGDAGGEPLAESERAVVRHWIEQGAPGLVEEFDPAALTHWSFRPIVAPSAPTVPGVEGEATGGRSQTEIDRFLVQRLAVKGLSLSPEAEPATLIRRVAFDLTGLPPTPAQIAAYLTDSAPGAYERMVERYLASPHYGERWGKYWLDAAGYADSNGYFSADSDRPLAYRYRDYVIGSLNADKPIDQFVREQLAGDEIAGYVPDGDVTGQAVDLLTATHYLRNAQDGTGESDGNPDEVRADRYSVIEGNLQIVMSGLLGLTIQCARCHAHKFEPIHHDEYYSLQAIFTPAYNLEAWLKPKERTVKLGTRSERAEHKRKTDRINEQVAALQASLASSTAPFQKQLVEERLIEAGVEPGERGRVLAAWSVPERERTDEQKQLLARHGEPLKVDDEALGKRFASYQALNEEVKRAIAEREKERPRPLEELAVLVNGPSQPPVHRRLERGQYGAPAEEVPPGVPAILCSSSNDYRVPDGGGGGGRRLEFARWLASPDNPLFARVFVNRVWRDHFGVGIVATVENLGLSGARPSHPELLDYLAATFIESGMSAKALHRRILHSAAYRQSSRAKNAGLASDPENRLLWRYSPRRLDADAIRDAMLAAAGDLDGRMGGPYVPTSRAEDGSVGVDDKVDGARRRSIYLQQRRTQVLTMLELFDAPAMVTNCTARNVSTVPLQSLALLNSPFARARGAALAERTEREAGADEEARLALAFLLTAGRAPEPDECAAALNFLVEQKKVYGSDADAKPRAWSDLCQMLLASNAFLYVE